MHASFCNHRFIYERLNNALKYIPLVVFSALPLIVGTGAGSTAMKSLAQVFEVATPEGDSPTAAWKAFTAAVVVLPKVEPELVR